MKNDKSGEEKPLWGRSPASIAVPACQRGRVPELYPSFRPMQRVYLSGRRLRCWACLSLSLSGRFRIASNCWPDLHSNNGGGSFAAGRA